MKIFHVYNEEFFEGLLKNGFINEDTGFKIQHVFSLPDSMKFNSFAKIGSKLHSMIKENNMPFYVDRIAGGVTYHKYEFDKSLIREYENILGDGFLGVQLHECASNRRVDWWRIQNRMNGSLGPYDLELLKEKSHRPNAVTPDGRSLYGFSQGTPEEYAPMRYAETPEAFFKEIRDLMKLRMPEVSGKILPCDSYYLFTKLEDELGMKSFMPEVGCQIPLMRLSVALARGVAHAAGKTFGVYYETWIHSEGGYTMPCYNKDQGNEWYLTQKTHSDDFTSSGPNGGSSRLLQKRIYYYALMSGADYLSEEWGLNCSYSNMTTFELSPYGEVKREFIRDALDYKGMKAKIPFAIVLPKKYYCVEIPEPPKTFVFGEIRDEYMRCILTPDEKKYYGHIENLLRFIYAREGDAYGNEGHVLTNSRFGDLFDIIYEDASDAALSRYEYLIDASPDSAFKKKCDGKYKVISSLDLGLLEKQIREISEKILPATADSLDWILSEDVRGRKFISVFNNEGNERSVLKGDVLIPEAARRVKITLKDGKIPEIKKSMGEGIKMERGACGEYYVELPPASFVIIEYK